jgi:hypothetical protein
MDNHDVSLIFYFQPILVMSRGEMDRSARLDTLVEHNTFLLLMCGFSRWEKNSYGQSKTLQLASVRSCWN